MCPLPQHSYYYEAHKVAASVWRMLRLVRGRQWGDQRPGGNCWPAVKSEATARPTASSASTPPTPSTSTPATGAAGAAASAGRVSWQPGYGGAWWYMVHGTWADLLPHSREGALTCVQESINVVPGWGQHCVNQVVPVHLDDGDDR